MWTQGIRCTHVDFGYLDGRLDSNKIPISRCLDGFDAVKDGYGTKDCNGHGTHCAGKTNTHIHRYMYIYIDMFTHTETQVECSSWCNNTITTTCSVFVVFL